MKNKLQLSPIVAGCMKWGQWGAGFTTPQYLQMINDCIEYNITSFDHADIYGSYTTEEEFGAALKQTPSLRNKIQLITKCGIKMPSPARPDFQLKSYDTSRDYIIRCAEISLQNLQTDYLDLYLIHRPSPLMNPEEIAEAFTLLKEQGKVLHFGVSNFMPSQLSLLHRFFPVEVNQFEISILHTDSFYNGQLDQCIRENILPMAWGPIGSGSLFSEPNNERNKRILKVAEDLSSKYQTRIENVFLAFLTHHPAGIIPVTGTSKIERLQDAMESVAIKIETDEWFMLLESSVGKEVD